MEKNVWRAFKEHIDRSYNYDETVVRGQKEILERKIFLEGHYTANDSFEQWWKQLKKKYIQLKLKGREGKD